MEFALAPTESRSTRISPIFWDGAVLRAVCVDIDDTLVNFTEAAQGALASMIGRSDMWWLWECVTEAHVAMVVAGEIEYATMHRNRTKAFLAELGVVVDDDDAARFERRRAAGMRTRFRLYDDAAGCLEWLRAAGVGIAAVTNASGAHQRTKVENVGLGRYVDHVVIAGEVGAAKPDPLIFHSACALLDCDPSEVLHVGDRLCADAIGARDAGLTGVWLNRGGESGEVPPDDIHVIDGLDALPQLLVREFAWLGTAAAR